MYAFTSCCRDNFLTVYSQMDSSSAATRVSTGEKLAPLPDALRGKCPTFPPLVCPSGVNVGTVSSMAIAGSLACV